ncbi:beta-1,6-N-acetylglucosaminyltransferase [Clostridium butyricum]|uniref:beta-1,6-N-acetylglucosaminyltransferase n=1 Tax=Clostridium butyricum TaxID=1492 RepID=UPI000DEAAD2B|nr:beta-1,6-N-acetylglucosaminyltransferase [Clostridium butyricum]AXB83691.1 glycosyl transferase [Clostridium butyricum]
MRHAYLIIAHGNWEQLEMLIKTLDYPNNNIYIHIDDKVKNLPRKRLENAAKISKVNIYKVYKVYWGSYELVETELYLFEQAHREKYDYYHLLSGADLPLKSQKEIHSFFEKNCGYEFVHFDKDKRLTIDKEIGRRTRIYHFLQNYRRRYKNQILNNFFTFIERVLLALQLMLGINRMKKYKDFEIKYGSQWVSITDSLVEYILTQKDLIKQIFNYTNCSDELFIQSLVHNSEFKEKLYRKNYDDNVLSNMRLIDLKVRGKNGNPYTWRFSDWNEIKKSNCLFARKFDMNIDKSIVDRIYNESLNIKS